MPLKRILWLFLSLLLIADITISQAQNLPKPAGYVNDFAGVMKPETKQQLEPILVDLKQKTGVEVAVVTVKDMGGLEVTGYATDLMKSWGIGSKEKNEGVLLLLALKERKVRIEVGYGLEGLITDARSGMILDQYVIPYFKNNDYDSGLSQGALALVALIAKDKKAEISGAAPVPPPRQRTRGGGGIPFFQLILIAVIILFVLGRRGGCLTGLLLGGLLGGGRGYRGHDGFGGFGGFGGGFGDGGFGGGGGGFGGFGGGFSGGGGASRGF